MLSTETIQKAGKMNAWRVRIASALDRSSYRDYFDEATIVGVHTEHVYGHARYVAAVLVWLGELSAEEGMPPDKSLRPADRFV